MSEIKLLAIPLKDVVPSPTNPRKTFDQTKTEELAASILEKGVLQPILVRAKGNKYEIVCGERRYRASKMVNAAHKNRNTIPAVIRELTDQEVREMQLIENFQREDVHPMEEAVAIKAVVESGEYSFEDLSHKVGKSITYLKQRMKLASLSEAWQEVFFANKMSISTAVKISCFPLDVQQLILDDTDTDIDLEEYGPIKIDDWDLRQYQGILNKASFDISDEKLLPEAGACTGCMHNTGFHNLFPEEDNKARCTNIKCFSTKSDISFIDQLEIAKQDPSVFLISTEYNSFQNPKFVKSLQDEGHVILMRYRDWEEESIDEEPILQNYDIDDYDSEEERLEDFEDDLKRYQRDFAAFTEAEAKGKLKKGFVVDGGDDKGKYLIISIKKSGADKTAKTAVESGNAAADDFDGEINRIKGKEIRAKEIDQNKIWDAIKIQFNPAANASMLKGEFIPIERKAIAVALYNKLEYTHRDDFRSLFKWDERKKQFPEVDEVTLRQMTRFYMLSVLPPGTLLRGYQDNKEASLSLQIADSYFPSVLKEVIDNQNKKAEKRTSKVNAAIKELQDKKKSLQEQQKPPKKTATKKSK